MRMRETDGFYISDLNCVEIIDKMGSDDDICDAARVSFSKSADMYSAKDNEKLIHYLAKHEHFSPFTHCFLKFRFRAPLFVARQFQKHQIGFAWNEVSRRYVDDDPWFFIPDSWRKRPDSMKQGSTFLGERPLDNQLLDSYKHKMREHAKDYKELRSAGVCPEQARIIMPQAMITEWIWSGSIAGWARFVRLRSNSHAQAECWPYAEAVRNIMDIHFPIATAALLKHESSLT